MISVPSSPPKETVVNLCAHVIKSNCRSKIQVTGCVYAACSQKPLKNVRVKIKGHSLYETCFTDERGYFKAYCPVLEEKYKIEFKHPDYKTYRMTYEEESQSLCVYLKLRELKGY